MTPDLDVGALAPLLAVGLGVLLLPLLQVWLARKRSFLGRQLTREGRGTYLATASALLLVSALILSFIGFGSARIFNPSRPMLSMDALTGYLSSAILTAALLTVLSSARYLASARANYAEFYALLLSSVAGMLLLVGATHLMLVFLALELMSLPLYALVGLKRESLRSGESALKYFLIGSFASAVFVYGASLVYGTTGELDLREIGAALDPENPVALLGAGLLVSALGFKIASAPFHQWAPDVYQGAPTTVTGFMAAAAKITAFAALIRVSVLMLQPALDLFYPIIWVLAFLSMSVGNLMALMQRNLKRLLAFSGVAHAGYLLVGILVGGPDGLAAVLFYLLAYVFMTVGAFTVIATLAREGQERDTLDDLVGLVHTQPFIAISMTVCAFSLLGLPGTAGFIAKFQVFAAAISRALTTGDGWLVTLVVIALLNTCISIVYYLRIPSLMFMQRPLADSDPGPPGTLERAVLLTCALACVILGLAPHDALPGLYQLDLLRLAELAAASLN